MPAPPPHARPLLPELRLGPELIEALVLDEVGEQGQQSRVLRLVVEAHLLLIFFYF